MSDSLSVDIWYGFVVEDKYELPWYATNEEDEEIYEGDYDTWWEAINEKPKNPFNYETHKKEYYEWREKWKKSHTEQIEEKRFGSYYWDMNYIGIAIPKIGVSHYDDCLLFKLDELVVSDEQIKRFKEFCNQHKIKIGKIGWHVSGIWG